MGRRPRAHRRAAARAHRRARAGHRAAVLVRGQPGSAADGVDVRAASSTGSAPARSSADCAATSPSPGTAATQGAGFGFDPEDIRHAQLIILWGTNTLITNRHLWPFIDEARQNGAEVICIDPLRTITAAAADWHVQPLPGTDAALALGMMNVIIERDLVDHDYVDALHGGVQRARRAREGVPARACRRDLRARRRRHRAARRCSTPRSDPQPSGR